MLKKVLILITFLPYLLQAQQWQSLFNGKDLSGWKKMGGNADFKVEGNQLVGIVTANTPNTFLITEKTFGDFVLELEVFMEKPLNSGVQFRSEANAEGRVYGYQMEIDPGKSRWTGGVYDEARRGWLSVPDYNAEAQKAFKIGQWNKIRIEAVGNDMRTFINNVPVTYLVDNLTPKGFIGLQVHSMTEEMKAGMRILWRNIRIQTQNPKLSPYDETPVVNLIPNHLSEQEKRQGYQLMFNGKDFTGWRSVTNPGKPMTRWTIKDGILTIPSSDGSETGNDIVTEKKYSAFEMVFDFKLSKGANSGVKYFVDDKFDSKGMSAIGLEYQILDDKNHPDAKQGVVGNRTLASLYDLIPSYKIPSANFKELESWKTGRIIVYPNNIVQHWLNGIKVLEYERKSNIFKALVARSKYHTFEGFGESDEGRILLQDHGDHVEYKSIKIRELGQ